MQILPTTPKKNPAQTNNAKEIIVQNIPSPTHYFSNGLSLVWYVGTVSQVLSPRGHLFDTPRADYKQAWEN